MRCACAPTPESRGLPAFSFGMIAGGPNVVQTILEQEVKPVILGMDPAFPRRIRAKGTRKPDQPVSTDANARLADKGKDVSHFFTGQGCMVQPIQRVSVDVTAAMLVGLVLSVIGNLYQMEGGKPG